MKNFLIISFLLLIGFNAFGQNVIEIKSKTGLKIESTIVDSMSNTINSGKVDIFIQDSLIRTIEPNKKGNLIFKLNIHNQYKLVFYASSYESKILIVNTEMSENDELNNGQYGWVFTSEIKLNYSLNNQEILNPFGELIYNKKSGFFEHIPISK